jgi:hypothetical protein
MVMKDLPCQKRRHVVIQSKDGSRKEVHRCANGISKNYKNGVDKSTCESCVLRQPLLKIAPVCKEHPPATPIWLEPYYKEDKAIIYPFREGIEQPPVPQGYSRKSEDEERSWWFVNEWGDCPYRQMMNRRTPRGDLQINAYCEAQNIKVKSEICKECLREVTEIGGNLDKEAVRNDVPLPEPVQEQVIGAEVPKMPGTGELIHNYWKAVKRWIKAGRPVRENLEVKRIHEEFCSKCDWRDPDSNRCKGCGCNVKPKGIALLNKIKMRTEHCPRSFW